MAPGLATIESACLLARIQNAWWQHSADPWTRTKRRPQTTRYRTGQRDRRLHLQQHFPARQARAISSSPRPGGSHRPRRGVEPEALRMLGAITGDADAGAQASQVGFAPERRGCDSCRDDASVQPWADAQRDKAIPRRSGCGRWILWGECAGRALQTCCCNTQFVLGVRGGFGYRFTRDACKDNSDHCGLGPLWLP